MAHDKPIFVSNPTTSHLDNIHSRGHVTQQLSQQESVFDTRGWALHGRQSHFLRPRNKSCPGKLYRTGHTVSGR
ncbi:uncharacterized protein RCC_08437 [Ramularia collo-cygni]|uniref:Uncharacterized protein n=1 Tax=Ramularia collo-cygni TaxID=112498 RepID=A0A2D3VCK4_9PEZI|nr:uncharacterized protein RCC_08437 [Ramularia collo-cygni]CZT22732.1 uncharacterized protein RCC_08437 [Ramularia collo-cygni]